MRKAGEDVLRSSRIRALETGRGIRIGDFAVRYALVVVIVWIGCLKFTAYESQGVFTHASNSPLLAWGYHLLDVRQFSRALGIVEIAIAALIAIKPIWPKVSAFGSVGAIGMFLTILSFLITDPGVWQKGYGFPALSASPGQFLIKDAVLLGAAIWTLSDAFLAVRRDQKGSSAGSTTEYERARATL